MNRKEEKTKRKINIKNKKGITLIALVITIIVLLILAGVSIAMLTGQNGILTQASKAKIEQSHAAVKEAIRLEYNEWKIEVEISSNVKLASTEIVSIQGEKEEAKSGTTQTFFDYLVSKRYVDSTTKIINVEKLTGSKQALGNGTGTDDVYKLVEQNGAYEIVYYENGTTNTVIDTITNTTVDDDNWDAIATDPKYFTFTFNEEDKTAVLTGIKDKYTLKGYYSGDKNISYPIAIIDGDEIITDVVIPKYAFDDKAEMYKITKIGDKAFCADNQAQTDEESRFSSFKLPDSIEAIGNGCFGKCENVNSIIFTGNIKSIGSQAFWECNKLLEINLPGNIEFIGEHAFLGWTGTQTVNFEMKAEPETGWDGLWNYAYQGEGKFNINWGVSM